jgi:hypothetical protein
MNPEKHLLADIPWQFFSTWTFKSLKVRESVWLKMFVAVINDQAGNFGVHFSKILWALRYELGEQSGRPHFHALIAGLPESGASVATCFSYMKLWEKAGGGQARVRVYDSTLAGVEYVLKGVDEAFTNVGANWYEVNKFGGRCNVTLSMSLIRHMQNRRRFGHRDRDGLFSKRLGYHARQRLKTGGRVEGDRRAGDTFQSGVRLFR